MAEQRLKLRLGFFVAATFITLAGLVVLFGSAPTLFSNRLNYTIVFPEAPGISAGTPIRKSGVRIGEVAGLDLDPESGRVRIHIAIDPQHPPRSNEEAVITRGFLSGDTAIDFVSKLGPDGQPLPRGDDYPPGSEIVGVPPITPRSLLTPASGILASAQVSLDRMVISFEKLERVAPQLERTLEEFELLASDVRNFIPDLKKTNDRIQNLIGGDPKALPHGAVVLQEEPNPDTIRSMVRDIRALLATVRPAIDEIRGTVRRVEPEITSTAKSARNAFDRASTTLESVNDVLSPENRKQFDELVKNLNAIGLNILRLSGGFQTLLDEAQRTIKNFDERAGPILDDVRMLTQPLALRSETLVKDVAESAGQLNKVLTEVREVVRVFGRENGTVQKLLTDPDVYNNLDAAAASLARVMARADQIGKDLEVFADKVARRPELIGIGGAIRPSSGLKESPFAPVPKDLPSYRPDWPPALPARSAGPEWLQPPAEPLPRVQGYPIPK